MTSEQQFPTTLHILLFLQISGIASLTLPRFPLALAVFLAAPTVIEVADLEAVELRLPEALVDLVVDEAGPAGGRVPRAHLRRVLGQQGAEVRRAVPARVQPREQLDVRPQRRRLLLRRLLREPRHHRVE